MLIMSNYETLKGRHPEAVDKLVRSMKEEGTAKAGIPAEPGKWSWSYSASIIIPTLSAADIMNEIDNPSGPPPDIMDRVTLGISAEAGEIYGHTMLLRNREPIEKHNMPEEVFEHIKENHGPTKYGSWQEFTGAGEPSADDTEDPAP